jgi:hypothetical protein
MATAPRYASAGKKLQAKNASWIVFGFSRRSAREWMMRSYPIAMVFVVVRTILAIPLIQRMQFGLQSVAWSVIATACFLPSFLIARQGLVATRRAAKARATMAA